MFTEDMYIYKTSLFDLPFPYNFTGKMRDKGVKFCEKTDFLTVMRISVTVNNVNEDNDLNT